MVTNNNLGVESKSHPGYNTYAPAVTGIPEGLVGAVSGQALACYLVLRSYERTPGKGAFPTTVTLGTRLGTTDRNIRRFIKELKDIGAVTVVARTNAQGKATSNRYYFPASLTLQLSRADVDVHPDKDVRVGRTGMSVEVSTTDTYLDTDTSLLDTEIGPFYERNTLAVGGSEFPSVNHEEVFEDLTEQHPVMKADEDRLGQTLETSPPSDPAPRKGHRTSASPRRGAVRGLDHLLTKDPSKTFEHSTPFDDPDLETSANEVVDLFYRLRTETLGVPPLTSGSRPGQLTSARYLLGIHGHPASEVLAVIRWIFGNDTGVASTWATSISKVFVLGQRYTQVLEAYNADLVAEIGPVAEQQRTLAPFASTNPQIADLRRYMELHHS